MKTFKTFVDESLIRQQEELEENYRSLAQKGIGAETKGSIKVGHGVDYYHPKTGDKHIGKIHSMSDSGYIVKDDKTGEKHSFDYFRKEDVEIDGEQIDERNKENADRRKMMDAERGSKFKAQGHPTPGPTSKQKDDQAHSKMVGRAIRKMSNESAELDEEVPMAARALYAQLKAHHEKNMNEESLDEASYTGKSDHRPGWMLRADPELAKKFKEKKQLAKKRQAAYGNPAAGKSVKEESEPDAAKKAYATIKAKMKNEDHQDMLMALYDELSEENQETFEAMLDFSPEKLLAFAQSHFAGE